MTVLRKIIGGVIVAMPVIGLAVIVSLGAGLWWAGPVAMLGGIALAALFVYGCHLLED